MGEFGRGDGTTPEEAPPPPPPGYAPFDPSGGTNPPPAWGSAPPPKKKFWSKKGVAILAFFAVSLGLGWYQNWRRDHGDPFTTPQTIGNATLMTDAESVAIAKEAREEVENVHRAVSGVYSVGGMPQFILIAGDADDESAKSVYDTFAKESKSSGTKVGASKAIGNVICAPVEDDEVPGVACFWGGKKSDGILLHFGTENLDVAGKVAQLAQAGVEA